MIINRAGALLVLLVLALVGCGAATPEGRVRERAAIDFHCVEEQVEATPIDPPAVTKVKASGCGQEAVYINVAPETSSGNWVLDAATSPK